MKMPPLLMAVMLVNVLVFVMSLVLPETVNTLALSSIHSSHYQHWQWFTHLFLHENVLHLLLNMYAIYFLGLPLLQTMRAWKWAVLYVLGGLAGAGAYALYEMWQPEKWSSILLGASGAAFALLAAFALRFPQARLGIMFLPFSVKAQYFVLTLVVYEIFAQVSGISLFGGNIAHMAHVGGAVMGAILAWLWRKRHIRLVK